MAPGILDSRPRRMAAIVVAGLLVGAAAALVPAALLSDAPTTPPGTDGSPDVNDGDATAATTFAFIRWPPTYLISWGVEAGQVEAPDDIGFRPLGPSAPPRLGANGEQIKMDKAVSALDNLRNSPDARFLPYVLSYGADMRRVFVRPDSTITGPGDLEGADIAYPVNGVQVAVLTLWMLEDRYGVNTSSITFEETPDPRAALSDGSVDAAISGSYRDYSSMRPIMMPYSYFNNRYGMNGTVSGYVVVQDASYADDGERVVTTLQQSAALGAQNVDSVAEYYASETEGAFWGDTADVVSRMATATGGDMLRPLTAERVEGLQRLYDRAYDEGLLREPVNISVAGIDQ